MKIKIKNFRGVSNAEIELFPTKITLVGGLNYQGKTSISQAVGCLLTGNQFPMNIKKTNIQKIVHNGTETSEVESDEPRVSLSWPECSILGRSVGISNQSAGLESIVDMDNKSRSKFLYENLKAEPSIEEFTEKLKENGLECLLEKLWENISALGWDSTYLKAKETGAKLKGAWEEITGENYGSSKATNYTPSEWEPILDGSKESDLIESVEQERGFVEASIATEAVSRDEIGRLKSSADSIQGYMDELITIGQLIEKQNEKIKNIQQELNSLPESKEKGEVQLCPNCKTPIRISNGKIVKADTMLTKENKEKIESRKSELSIELLCREKELKNLESKKTEFNIKLSSAKEAKEKLEKSQIISDKTGTEDAKRKLLLAETRLKSFQRKKSADAKAQSISQNQILCSILSPDGLRKEKIQSVLEKFNNGLKTICDIGKWGTVKIDNSLDIIYNGMPLQLCSQSENFITKTTLQIGFSLILKDIIVIIDGIDILDKRGRNGLFNVLSKYKLTALVCSTIYDKKDLPDLSKIGGRSYWVEGGYIGS